MLNLEKSLLSTFRPELAELILEHSSVENIPKGTEILKASQYVKVLPMVLEGLIKVFSRFEDRELLLYYLEPSQSCIMSFYAAFNNSPSKVYAQTEEDSKLLLIPVRFLPMWLKDYPELHQLFYNQYNLRYTELLDTISHLLLDKMDKRLFEHLKRKSELKNHSSLKISHGQLANELGTAREVISRVIKKLEIEGKVEQKDGIITVLHA